MVVKVGINGFGRVGRVVFRTCLQHTDLQIAAINDPAIEVEYICYLIKFDSTHGKLKGEITHNENEVKINDVVIRVLHHKVPSSIPWQTAGVQYVVEASGMFTSLEKASGHLASDGVKRVIVTAPSIDVPMIIIGVNENKLYPEHKVMSCGSSTLYCLAPIVKVLEDSFGVQDGFITSIHAMTPSLKPLDGLCLRGKHWRDHRSIHQNIIPATTGACKALGKIIPQVKDKMAGLAFRVPIVNVSVLDLTIRLKKETTIEEIAQKIVKASKSHLQNIIKISCEETVSSDFVGDRCSCILDVNSSLQLNPDYFKLVCWYENEYSYACRVVDSILFSEKQLDNLQLKSKMTYVRPRPYKKQDMVQQTDFCLKVTSEIKYDFPKIPCSFSQNNEKKKMIHILPANKNFLTKNTTDSQKNYTNSEVTKKTDLIKIWNEANKPNNTFPQLNKKPFFHAHTENAHSTDCLKAQERLEKVKREFSKMVDITEDLLKKSYNSNFKLESNVAKEGINKSSITNMVANCKEEIKKLNNKILETNKYEKDARTYYKAFEASGDRKQSVSTITSKMYNDCSKEDVDSSSMSNNKSNYSDYSVDEIKKPLRVNMDYSPSLSCSPNVIPQIGNKNVDASLSKLSRPEMYYSTSTCPLDTTKQGQINCSLTSCPEDATKFAEIKDKCVAPKTNDNIQENTKKSDILEPSNINNFKDHVTKTINNLIDGLSKNFQLGITSLSGDKNCLEPGEEGKHTNDKISLSNNAQHHPTSVEKTATGDKTINETHITEKLSASDKSFSSNSFQPQFSFDKISSVETPPYDKENVPETNQQEDIKMRNKLTLGDDKIHAEDEENFKGNEAHKVGSENSFNITDNEEDTKEKMKPINKLKLNVIDEQLKKRNIVIIKDKEEIIDTTSYLIAAENNTTEIDEYTKFLELQKQNLKSSSRFILNTDNDKKNGSTNNVSSVSGDVQRNQDIYDKLDSASATDSDNSFRIDGRKSQVIQLSDLTTSLDDLERLDKICRIIEISDELSDKLFSALDSGEDDYKSAQKKWSFKDLCEKIRLDDFCNKVFKNNF